MTILAKINTYICDIIFNKTNYKKVTNQKTKMKFELAI